MNRYLIASILALLLFAPSAMADSSDPIPGQRLCYHYSDGSEGACSIFPVFRYITQSYPSADGTNSIDRRFLFEDGSYLIVKYPSMDISAPLSAPTFGKWGWVDGSTFLRDEPIPAMESSDQKDVKYICGPFKIGKKSLGVISLRGINCRNIFKILSRKSLRGTGWKCASGSCRKSKRIWFRAQEIVQSNNSIEIPQKNDLAKPCGQYHVDRDYVVWAHDCNDVSDELLSGWINSLSGDGSGGSAPSNYACAFNVGKQMSRCSAPHGCVMMSTGVYDKSLIGIEYYGQYMQMPRDSCTQIDFK